MPIDSDLQYPQTSPGAEGRASMGRQYVQVGSINLEFGGRIDDVVVAYETFGTFTGNNAVLIEHALTGDARLQHVGGVDTPELIVPDDRRRHPEYACCNRLFTVGLQGGLDRIRFQLRGRYAQFIQQSLPLG